MSALTEEVGNVRRSVGLLQEFPRALLALTGADRVSFLHNLVSHDIKGLPVRQGRLACLLDRHGKIQAALIVHAHPDELILEMDPIQYPKAQENLSRFLITEDVQFKDQTGRWGILALFGPLASEALRQAWPGIQLPVNSLQHTPGLGSSGIAWIVRWDLLRMPGFFLWVDPLRQAPIRDRLLAEGRPLGIIPISSEAFEILRIEAGMPWPGKEMTEAVILNELGEEEWVSFTKGCFVGQEIVARIKHRAHPPRWLKGFLIEGPNPPPARSPIELESEPVGMVTSAAWSPTLDRVIALGFLKYGLAATQLKVRSPSGCVGATLTELPFVR